MFMRFLQLQVNPEFEDYLTSFYNKTVIPDLQQLKSCLYTALIRSNKSNNEFISMTLWKTRKQAEAYEKSATFRKFLERIKPFLSESTEWKLQLSEKLELEYTPAVEEPVLKGFKMTAHLNEEDTYLSKDKFLYVRLLSLSLQENKIKEFRRIYSQEIIPTLQNTPGCLYAYLIESLQDKKEVISVTIWDSQTDAEEYETSGRFGELVNKVQHTLSKFYRWKMALEKSRSAHVTTSEDLKINYYGLVSGKSFKP